MFVQKREGSLAAQSLGRKKIWLTVVLLLASLLLRKRFRSLPALPAVCVGALLALGAALTRKDTASLQPAAVQAKADASQSLQSISAAITDEPPHSATSENALTQQSLESTPVKDEAEGLDATENGGSLQDTCQTQVTEVPALRLGSGAAESGESIGAECREALTMVLLGQSLGEALSEVPTPEAVSAEPKALAEPCHESNLVSPRWHEPSVDAARPEVQKFRVRTPAHWEMDPELSLVRPDEEEAMKRIEEALAAELADYSDWEDVSGDRRLLRFLRGLGDVEAATAQLREALAWRTSDGIDAFRQRVQDMNWSSEPFPEWKWFTENVLPLDINAGRTAEGHLVFVDNLSKLNFENFIGMGDERRKLTLLTMFELLSKKVDDLSVEKKRLIKVCFLRDLRGLGPTFFFNFVRNRTALSAVQLVMRSAFQAHPETMDKVVCINVPSAFFTVWSILSARMTERARAKFVFLDFPYNPTEAWAQVGARPLLAACRVRTGASLPGSGSADVPGNDYVELALEIPLGRAAEWSWTGAGLVFTALGLPERPDPTEVHSHVAYPPIEGSTEPRGRLAATDTVLVCLFRWSNLGRFAGARQVAWTVALV